MHRIISHKISQYFFQSERYLKLTKNSRVFSFSLKVREAKHIISKIVDMSYYKYLYMIESLCIII